jgi:hypothetical protein
MGNRGFYLYDLDGHNLEPVNKIAGVVQID